MDEATDQFFLDALKLFESVRWLHDVPVTQILFRGGLEALPAEWLEDLMSLENCELNSFVTDKTIKSEWTDSLKEFVQKCRKIDRLSNLYPSLASCLPAEFTVGLNPKKQHEIMHLAHLVHQQCLKYDIKTVVDLGAGLGYVCQLLYHLYGYHVLGLEASEANVNKARDRQRKLYPTSVDHVKYVQCNLTGSSAGSIESLVLQEFHKHEDICLIGLHACGDLSGHASKMFAELKAARLLILISCCYHKLSLSESIRMASREKQYFRYFPMSARLKDAARTLKSDVGEFLRQPFLRLACQESAKRWNNMSEKHHDEHSFHVLARAVLQLYASQNGYDLKKLVRKGTRKSQCLSFETYIKDSLLRYSFESDKRNETKNNDKLADHDVLTSEITKLWDEHRDKSKAIEIYTALQLILQGPAESLILQDRLCWFEEHGFETAIVPVTDKELSPRSHAVVSHKR